MNEFDKKVLNDALGMEKSYFKAYTDSNDDLLMQIAKIRKNGVDLLENLCIKYNLTASMAYEDIDCSEIRVCFNGEKKLCEFYEKSCENLENEELKDLFFRLWATSHNDYMSVLYANLQEKTSSDEKEEPDSQNNPFLTKDMVKFLEDIKKIPQKTASKEEVKNALNSPHFSFFCGVAAGGVLAAGINEYLKDKPDEQISKQRS